MKWHSSFFLLIGMFAVAPACAAPSTAADGSGSPSAQKQTRRNASVLSAAEIDAASQPDAFTLVQALRPQWLKARGSSSFSAAEYVKVYQDGMLLGGPAALRQIPVRAVVSMQYLDGMTATQRFGTDHGNGAIIVQSRN